MLLTATAVVWHWEMLYFLAIWLWRSLSFQERLVKDWLEDIAMSNEFKGLTPVARSHRSYCQLPFVEVACQTSKPLGPFSNYSNEVSFALFANDHFGLSSQLGLISKPMATVASFFFRGKGRALVHAVDPLWSVIIKDKL